MTQSHWNRLRFQVPQGFEDESILSFSTAGESPIKIQVRERDLPKDISFSDWTRSELQKRTSSKAYSLDDFDIGEPDENNLQTAQISQSHSLVGSILLTLEVWICARQRVTQLVVSGDSESDAKIIETLQGLVDSLEFELDPADD